MNLFFLNQDPLLAAYDYELSHLNKIRVEIGQMASGAFITQGMGAPDASSIAQINHPTSRWMRESRANWNWTMAHWHELIRLFKVEYGTFTQAEVKACWIEHNQSRLTFPKDRMTPVRLSMTDDLKHKYGIQVMSPDGKFTDYVALLPTAVKAYREYYTTKVYKNNTKKRWRNNTPPEWYK